MNSYEVSLKENGQFRAGLDDEMESQERENGGQALT
jgi:hypothetical protein